MVINRGLAGELQVDAHSTVRLQEVRVVLRRGTRAPTADVALLHAHGTSPRDVAFGASVDVYLDGEFAFSGHVAPPVDTVIGGAALQTLECVGRRRLLYTDTVKAAKTYANMDSGAIAKDVIDLVFSGQLTTTNVNTMIGVTIEFFEVEEGEVVGEVIERLIEQDGAYVEVDEDNDVTYDLPSEVAQAVITEVDLVGPPSERTYRRGVRPPVTAARVRGGSGYKTRVLRETQNAYYDLTASTRRIATRIRADAAMLNALDFYLNRTTGANLTGSLSLEVWTDNADGPAGDGTSDSNLGGAGGTYGAVVLDSLTKRAAVVFTAGTGGVAPKIKDGGVDTPAIHIAGSTTGAPGTFEFQIWTVDGSGKPLAYMATIAGVFQLTNNLQSSGADGPALVAGQDYALVIVPTGGTWDATNKWSPKSAGSTFGAAWISSDSGATYTSPGANTFAMRISYRYATPSAKVDFSEASIPNDSVYPTGPAWPGEGAHSATYAPPKLALTEGSYYWLVLLDTSATASKYWSVGYDSTLVDADTSTSTDGGASWTGLGKGTHRLYYGQGEVSVYGESAAGIAAHGRWFQEYSVPDAADEATAQRILDLILERNAEPGDQMDLPLADLRPDLTLYAPVRVKRPVLGVDADFEVVEITHVVQPGMRPRTRVLVGTPDYNAAHALEELRKVAL